MASFGRLSDLVENGKGLKFNEALFFVFSKNDIKEFVIELNTDGQLWLGVDGKGRQLSSIGGNYADRTVELKKIDGLPFDKVTLFQTGEFYDSFKVKTLKKGIVIEADTIKDGDDLQDSWGNEIIGLNDESITSLTEEIAPIVVNYILRELLR